MVAFTSTHPHEATALTFTSSKLIWRSLKQCMEKFIQEQTEALMLQDERHRVELASAVEHATGAVEEIMRSLTSNERKALGLCFTGPGGDMVHLLSRGLAVEGMESLAGKEINAFGPDPQGLAVEEETTSLVIKDSKAQVTLRPIAQTSYQCGPPPGASLCPETIGIPGNIKSTGKKRGKKGATDTSGSDPSSLPFTKTGISGMQSGKALASNSHELSPPHENASSSGLTLLFSLAKIRNSSGRIIMNPLSTDVKDES
eukprot:gene27040-2271_t